MLFRFPRALLAALAVSLPVAGNLCAAPKRDAKKEQTLEERLMRPDMQQEQPIQLRNFQGSSNFEMKAFSGEKSFSTQGYGAGDKVETAKFLGIPLPWMKKKQVETSGFSSKDTSFAVNAYQASNDSSLAKKEFAWAARGPVPKARAVPVRRANTEGTAQGYHNEMKENLQKDMSVEQVRELLNKAP